MASSMSALRTREPVRACQLLFKNAEQEMSVKNVQEELFGNYKYDTIHVFLVCYDKNSSIRSIN